MDTIEPIRETRRLTRPKDGRWLGGVAAGLGAYFDLNPAIYRLAFAALALAGGTGILLYLAAWAVIPEEGEEDSLVAAALKRQSGHPSRAIGIAVLAFAAAIALSSARIWPSPGNLWLAAALGLAALVWWQLGAQEGRPRRGALLPIAIGVLVAAVGAVAILDLSGVVSVDWRIVLGAMVIVTGTLVVVGATTGRATGAVIVLAVALLAALALAVTVRVPLFAGVGDKVVHPASISSVQRKYELGIGDFTVNLSDVRLPAGETRVKTTLGIGDLLVRVPWGVTVVVDGRASAGEVTIFGRTSDGTSVHSVVTAEGRNPARVLVLDARVGIGQLEVVRG
jgi:phage shock protein PspC (stress-responsive transcriptional regulator)